ncbi:hypothetical protein A2533_05065 [Candidatus Falkowbacteria bacterium RIFOXYD2_FULL_35_9]|uniref:Band 7 domain-containing protein n=1 Tax=Candidatus Falkowbacteria bacterium RIFOXYC2_FULL_36_12 TaxID=1798002 RepID=A0A1F5SZV8_9BACT|nr:MAG: hypothetical protein A2300_01760 [Candidatus Falkowbacteria bacterium RIFOXYB2_FULL_35_7]OGF32240.1 MAG: hypothetical protein A2478_02855 [Candidatus Falkowbacteria bacterium RIFOXYC2_FULL_36_12]OGF34156.1 MAG: hypothetical protein A2223_01325 [Candidatus Falkowbacteria bacterium RIFOXYA2_FULL_35_8]OGF46429.1 MAG: hypothetical protein A2533_05065 [Candidatus Falkowbacteria bacterium RIFOXYD2_FULL_35_9]
MKRISLLIIAICFIGFYSNLGCVGCDRYETVAQQTNRVCVIYPFAFFTSNEGGAISSKIYTTGKHNFDNGPTHCYDFDLANQETKVAVEVLMTDKVNLPLNINCSWRMIPETVIDAAVHYLPADQFTIMTAGNNAFRLDTVSVEDIFNRNVLPYFDEVSRDVIDESNSKTFNMANVAKEIERRLTERLSQVRIPRIKITSESQFEFNPEADLNDPTQSISILDVINIEAISIPDYKAPDSLLAVISNIQTAKAQVVQLREMLKQAKLQNEIMKTKAEADRDEALNLRDALARNPNIIRQQLFHMLQGAIDDSVAVGTDGHHISNTRVFIIPENMTNSLRLQLE